jgi:hypothetical protein
MEPNFVMTQQRPTPEDLLRALVEIVPGFLSGWESPDNCFREDDGSFSLHGVFSEFTGYLRGHFSELEDTTRRTLFEFVEQCVLIDPNSDSGVSNAACTCFLENLAGEGELSEAIGPYLGRKSKEYFDQWN